MTLPLVVPPAVTGMMFLLMLDGSFGVLSQGLCRSGCGRRSTRSWPPAATALAGVLLADIWQWTPFMVLIMLAGLRALPKEPFEAAAIDGATASQAFFRLTLPMLSKIIALAVLIRGVDLFRIYDYVKVMTDSGPGTATETLTVLCRHHLLQECRLSLRLDDLAVHADPGDRHLEHLHQAVQGAVLMQETFFQRRLRDVAAILVVGLFMFPLFWWALTSIKPTSAIFDKDEIVLFNFKPTLVNYAVTMLGKSRAELAIDSGNTFGVGGASSYDSRQTILDSIDRRGRLDGLDAPARR